MRILLFFVLCGLVFGGVIFSILFTSLKKAATPVDARIRHFLYSLKSDSDAGLIYIPEIRKSELDQLVKVIERSN